MKLLAPDLLDLTRGLTPALNGVGFGLGLLLWLFGAASHRFWLALFVTLLAGVIGVQYGPEYEVQPLVAGLLLALAAGALALSLVRVLLFVAGGVVVLAAVHTLHTGWNDFVCFLCGGLAGVLLYRWWVTVLSALCGSLLMSYSLLSILDRLGKLQCVPWAERNGPLLNWAVVVVALLGVLAQFLLERRWKKKRAKGVAPAPEGPPKPSFLAKIRQRLVSWLSWPWMVLPLPRVQVSWKKPG